MYGVEQQIVATLGPGSDSPDTIEALIQAGVNVFRLNFSHGLAEHHVVTAGHVRRDQSSA